MRHFYIFQVKPEIAVMGHMSPYELFRTLEMIYYEKDSIFESSNLLKQFISPVECEFIDYLLWKKFKTNYFYTKYRNFHTMRDIFRSETTKLEIYKNFMKLETNVVKPRFLEELQKNRDLFVCDFETKDYFWLEDLKFTFQ